MEPLDKLPIIDVSPLVGGAPPEDLADVAGQIESACRRAGFFYVTGHGVPAELIAELDSASREFFELPEAAKMEIAMDRGGRAWRGFFPVGAELTSGRPDLKEGVYFGTELSEDHPRVRAGLPLHGPNLFPRQVPRLRTAVLAYLDALTGVAQSVLRGIAVSLDLDADYFAAGYTREPTVLFRVFHYPPAPPADDSWGVGEHTDYGLLTLLAQDDNGGLAVRTPDGWVDAPPIPGTFVCNIGDMLDRMTGGYYLSTPHRVRNTSGRERLSYPFFFDPDFTAEVPPLPDRARVGGPGRRRGPLGRRRPARLPRHVRRLSTIQSGEGVSPAIPPTAGVHMRHMSLIAGGAVAVIVAAALAGCAPQDSATPASTASPTADACAKDQLKTLTAGKLTIGTDDPVYPPWFTDNKPDNGQGFEGAVAAAVATKMGYAPAEVAWVRVTFNNAIAPGPKAYDFDINEFSITEERKQAVDFSSPYYDVTQAVIALKSSKIAGAKSLADLGGAKLGAQVGTTSLKAITEVVKPTTQPSVYNSNDDAKKALENGQIDGLVLDLPTAFFVTAAEIDDSLIVGQLAQPSGTPEQFGLVLDKGSALTACVSKAVDALKADGTLAKLETQWLAQVAGAPVLS